MFNNQRLSIFLGLSLLTLPVVSAEQADAQTIELQSLSEHGQSKGGSGVEGSTQSNADGVSLEIPQSEELLGNKESVSSDVGYKSVSETKDKDVDAVPMTYELGDSDQIAPKSTQLIELPHQPSEHSVIPVSPETNTLANPPTDLNSESEEKIEPLAQAEAVSIPESPVSLVVWVGLATVFLVQNRLKKNSPAE